MARAIWTGAVAFGLVNVPVGLYSATEDKTIHFRQFQRGTSSRIRYRRVNEDTGEEVEYSDIVKGYDLGEGEYVVLEPDELEAVEPGRSRTIDITDFVDASQIDPIYFQRTYYLAPQDQSADRAYTLLVRAMEEAGRVGIATFVMRSKQYLAAVRPQGDVLTLETMFFADEVRDPREEIDRLPTDVRPTGKDVDMATSLIETMTTPWDPGNYRDTYRDRVLELIEAKRRGDEIVQTEQATEGGEVVDLLEVLRRSVDAARGRSHGNRHGAAPVATRPAGSTGDGPRRGPDDLTALSKKDLYRLAKELDVPGRSGLSKEELRDAIAAHRQGRMAS